MIKSYLGVLGGASGDFPWAQGEFLAPIFWAGRLVGRRRRRRRRRRRCPHHHRRRRRARGGVLNLVQSQGDRREVMSCSMPAP